LQALPMCLSAVAAPNRRQRKSTSVAEP
jgi:hypothetical protein